MRKGLAAFLVLYILTASAGCSPEAVITDERPRPMMDAPRVEQSKPAVTATKSPDISGDVPVTWTPKSGTARTDMLGFLSDAPLAKSDAGLEASEHWSLHQPLRMPQPAAPMFTR